MFSTTGIPLIRLSSIISSASQSGLSGAMVRGLTTIPASNFFTMATSIACSSIVKFLCTTPIPPTCAMAIAKRCSVTVSIAAEISGTLRFIFWVKRVLISVLTGKTAERAGSSKTSSKVKASRIFIECLPFSRWPQYLRKAEVD